MKIFKATGKTYRHEKKLKERGWQRNPVAGFWWLEAETWDTEDIRLIERLPGVTVSDITPREKPLDRGAEEASA